MKEIKVISTCDNVQFLTMDSQVIGNISKNNFIPITFGKLSPDELRKIADVIEKNDSSFDTYIEIYKSKMYETSSIKDGRIKALSYKKIGELIGVSEKKALAIKAHLEARGVTKVEGNTTYILKNK